VERRDTGSKTVLDVAGDVDFRRGETLLNSRQLWGSPLKLLAPRGAL
jgi:hypothetical protein